MGCEWPTKSFAELISSDELRIGDGYRAKNDELGGDGLIFLRAGQVTDSHISFLGVDRFHHEEAKRFGEKISRSGDVVITTKGNSTGRVSYVTSEMPPFVYSPHLSYWRASVSGCLNQSFLRAWSRGPEFVTQLGALSRSTDMAPYLSLTDQRRLSITIPPIEIQSWVGAFNSAIEERIDLLRQTNTTFEAIAQALFKSWFVDFDPVSAKVEGREPEVAAQGSASGAGGRMPGAAMDAATAALFPSEFEASELGLIPKGWRVDEIGNAAKCLGGGTPSTKEEAYWTDGEFHWVTPKDLSGMQAPVLTTTNRKVTEAGLSRISSGLLPIGTLLMSSRAPIGYLALAGIPTAINQGFIAMPPGGMLPPVYLYFWTQTNMDSIKQKANGSTFMEISKSAFRPIKLCVPPPELVDAFVAIASPLMDRIEANEHQRVSLTELRDTLLPRLISGKLRLPDAERDIEATP